MFQELLSAPDLRSLARRVDAARAYIADLESAGEDTTVARHALERTLQAVPTYGGEEPESTLGVWSWDAENLLTDDGLQARE